MRAHDRRPLALAGMAAILLAGCMAPSSGLYLGPTGVPADAPSVIGDGDFPLRVLVLDEGRPNATVAGAPIVVHHIPKPATAPAVHQLMRMNATLGGRTGPDGVLVVKVDKGQTYSFLTAVPNGTSEARHLVKITDAYRDRPLVIAVFRTAHELDYTGKIPLTVRPDTPYINLGFANAKWWPTEVRFHEDNATHRQYLFRLSAFEATLTVVNPPGSHSNIQLRLVLSSEEKQPITWDMRGGVISPTAPTVKRMVLTPYDLANIATMKNPVLRIGPMTFESAGGASCVPWDLHINTAFDTAPRPQARRPYYYATGPEAAIPQPPAHC